MNDELICTEFLGLRNPALYKIATTENPNCIQSKRTSLISELFMHCHHPPYPHDSYDSWYELISN
jgi:hypothetical protein